MISAIGALVGLVVAIVLIIRRVPAAYSLMAGALAGGLVGDMGLVGSVAAMTDGVRDVTPAILRILSAGVLSGVLIKTGASETISLTIIRRLGRDNVYLALALAVMLLTAVGVFVDVAVITVAPVALSVSRRFGIAPVKLLLMMIGGGKCGNIVSPNPNTIIAAENFNAPLSSVMAAGIIPALIGLMFTVVVVRRVFPEKNAATLTGEGTDFVDEEFDSGTMPSFGASVFGPVIAILLLALRPLAGIAIDPLVALPVGGLAGVIAMKKMRSLLECCDYGLSKMIPVAVLLVGTGTIAGIIKASEVNGLLVEALSGSAMGEMLLAPLSGIIMSAATASTTAGATIASASFAPAILAAGISGIWGAAMTNAGATVADHLPHGSFFHATGGAMNVAFRERMKLIPYESAIGIILAVSSVLTYELFKLI